jgi:hypothetical protein
MKYMNYFDWTDANRDGLHIPGGMPYEPGDPPMTEISSLVAAYGDPWINPCSGGAIGRQDIAAKADCSDRHAGRTVLLAEGGEVDIRQWTLGVGSLQGLYARLGVSRPTQGVPTSLMEIFRSAFEEDEDSSPRGRAAR